MATTSLLSTVLIYIGIALFAGGIFLFFRQRLWMDQALPADGIVIDLLRRSVEGEYVRTRTEQGSRTEPKYLYRPLIRFKTQSGQTVTFLANLALRPAPYAIGDCVDVLYNPQDPRQAQINSFIHLWFYPLMFLFFGLFMMAMGVVGQSLG